MGYPNYAWILPDLNPEQRSIEDSSSRSTTETFLLGTIEISCCSIDSEESPVTVSGKVSMIILRLHFVSKEGIDYCLIKIRRLFKNSIWNSG